MLLYTTTSWSRMSPESKTIRLTLAILLILSQCQIESPQEISVEYLSIANIFNAVTYIFIFFKTNLKLSILSFHTFANNIWLEEMWQFLLCGGDRHMVVVVMWQWWLVVVFLLNKTWQWWLVMVVSGNGCHVVMIVTGNGCHMVVVVIGNGCTGSGCHLVLSPNLLGVW